MSVNIKFTIIIIFLGFVCAVNRLGLFCLQFFFIAREFYTTSQPANNERKKVKKIKFLDTTNTPHRNIRHLQMETVAIQMNISLSFFFVLWGSDWRHLTESFSRSKQQKISFPFLLLLSGIRNKERKKILRAYFPGVHFFGISGTVKEFFIQNTVYNKAQKV